MKKQQRGGASGARGKEEEEEGEKPLALMITNADREGARAYTEDEYLCQCDNLNPSSGVTFKERVSGKESQQEAYGNVKQGLAFA